MSSKDTTETEEVQDRFVEEVDGYEEDMESDCSSESEDETEQHTSRHFNSEFESDESDIEITNTKPASKTKDLTVLEAQKVIVCVRSLARQIRKCGILMSVFESEARAIDMKIEKLGRLILDMKVRWNSTYKMADRFVLFRSVIQTMTEKLDTTSGLTNDQKKRFQKASLNDRQWQILESIRVK